MPTIDQLNAALLKADAAGDTQNAQLFANQIKTMRTAAAPATQTAPQSPEALANTAGQEAGAGEGALSAGIGQAAHQGTFASTITSTPEHVMRPSASVASISLTTSPPTWPTAVANRKVKSLRTPLLAPSAALPELSWAAEL